MFRKVVEFFIPVQNDSSAEYQRRVRLVAYAIVVTMVFALFYVTTSWVAGYFTGLTIMLCSWVCYLILLFLMKKGLNIFKVANIFGLIGVLSIYGCIYFSGGFESPVLPWLASSPIVLLLIAGKKIGYFWASVAVLMVLSFGLMDSVGFQFPKEYYASKEDYFTLSCQTGLVLIIFFISIVFENLRVKAFNQVSHQKDALETTLSELKSTQAQLIQSEKMASLGELTAGIAHEIQNPLNFVNNFSEVNTELIDELEKEVNNGNYDEVKAIAKDIKDNEQKINHHGKRAGDIVKGMLQHSRSSNGVKEPTNINILADEYLRLAYHGFRAKDKSFNATMKTEFDETIGSINIIPQEISRVLLNLITNAFYVVNEKKRNGNVTHEEGIGNIQIEYEPTVTVKTSLLHTAGGQEALISVKDNGNGIPAKVLDKIFQPFFTTKPTGEGTGLGLSLAYDIVKAHGGELKVETIEGEGSEFIVQLPVV
jgi:signal transduction histidine kinase